MTKSEIGRAGVGVTDEAPTHPAAGRSRLGLRASAAVAIALIPLVMHARPATAVTGSTGPQTAWLTTNVSTNTTLGLSIMANANLTGAGGAPTGTVTFQAFGPGDDSCSSPVFTSTVAVAGNPVSSPRFVPPHAGTYRWRSSYSGDQTYAPAGPTPCDPGVAVTVGKASAYLTAAAGPTTPAGIHGTATVNGTQPTGSVTFTLTGPDDMFCSGPPAFTSTVAVNGTGSYDSATFTPTRAGNYTWRAIYSGDTDNLGTAVTPCQNPNAVQTVTVAPPSNGFSATGNDQLSVFRPDTGTWYIQDTVGGTVSQLSWGQDGDIPVPADYNGDGKIDAAVYRPSTGLWLVQGMPAIQWGLSSDIPVPGDYNGDGRTDIAVYRPSSSGWFVRGILTTWYGVADGTPVPGDYNGDGRTDVAVYRASTGDWFVKDILITRYGVPGDIPVPGDYNGDGHTDVAVWRSSTGQWLVRGILITALGRAGDIPQPGDYDNDGRTDLTVFRPSTGTFYLVQTTAGSAVSNLGVVGDVATSLVGTLSSLTGLLG
jgi:hypothetical protein